MIKKLAIAAIWLLTVFILKKNDLLSLDLVALKDYIAANQQYAAFIFIGLWVVRLLAFIPGVTLMIVGGICFGPVQGFILSMIGMAISETMVYVISKAISGNQFTHLLERKNPQLKVLLMKHNYKFLALGIICPIAPSDVICFMSASIGIHYRTYILTVLISNIPIMMLFSFLGITLGESLLGAILILLSAAVILVITIKIWTNLKQEPCNS